MQKRQLTIVGDIAYVPLTQGYVAIINASMSEEVAKHNWCAKYNPDTATYYAKTWFNGRTVYLSRFVYEMAHGPIDDKIQIDHRDGDTLDDRLDNLRPVNHRLNQQNRRGHRDGYTSSGGVVGVTFRKDNMKNPWIAQIRIDGKLKHLGSYTTIEQSSQAYQNVVNSLTVNPTTSV